MINNKYNIYYFYACYYIPIALTDFVHGGLYKYLCKYSSFCSDETDIC